MINKRLILGIPHKDFHFSKIDIEDFRKYFSEVIPHYHLDDPTFSMIKKTDIIFVYQRFVQYANVECAAKFGILYPGFGFHPFILREQMEGIAEVLDCYDAVVMNEGPIWECYKGKENCFVVPPCASHRMFKKTRIRDKFERIIQVANSREPQYKGRLISEAAMKLMPYSWELIPENDNLIGNIPWENLPLLYQAADGFLSPNQIGSSPGYYIDGKYTTATMEAGLSGCIVFWHDCMKIGNTFETIFEISSDPKEIAKTVLDVVNSINLEKHSLLTSQEFYEKCNSEASTKAKFDIMKNFC